MGRQKPEASGTTWQDISECLPAWEIEKGVRILVQVVWQSNLAAGAYMEIVLLEGSQPDGKRELLRVRKPFPTRKASGQAGAVLHAVFEALNALDAEPWLWPRELRQAARGEG